MFAQAALFHAVSPLSLLMSRARVARVPVALVLAGWLLLSAVSFAQAAKPAVVASAATAATAKSSSAARASVSRPSWVELSPKQQQALMPLASSWDTTLSEPQKRKWLEISRNYPSLPPEGQATLHSRMNEWIALSPEQRAQARLNFATTKELSKQLTPEQKKAKWQTYQALSPEEKRKLAEANANAKPSGAAIAVKPVAVQKLAAVPPNPNKPAPVPAHKITPSQPTPVAAQGAGAPATAP
jgi:Protein of unknown function (DUF3106)